MTIVGSSLVRLLGSPSFVAGAREETVELPRGVTGFRDADEPPLTTCDLSTFREVCHSAARSLRGRLLSVESPLGSAVANFGRAHLELPGGPISVLLNLHFPIVAFAERSSDDASEIRFVEAPALRDLLLGSGAYTVMSTSEAGQRVTAEACRLLGPAELKQLHYWRPRTIGEVVFNRWD